MKETRFINQNKEKWEEAETLLNSPVKDPDKLSNLFVQIVDDLSYSRTYYPNRSVRVYLNKIAKQYFTIIYSHKKEKSGQFMRFWLDELPQIVIHSKKELLISLLVFVASFCIGIFSAHNDPQFSTTILGHEYIAMTNENIENGDPMAVYKKSQQVDMFLGITLNNLMVAFRTYVLGLFLAIGTLASLLHNGIMVGCFQYYFAERGLLLTSSLSIWLHGTLEISSIILAGGAGLTLASGLIFPGSYSRFQSLQRSGIRSLKLMLGITPIFVLAAVIESFLTRYTDAPTWLKISLIFLSATLIVGYFVIFPWLKSKTGFEQPLKDIRLAPTSMVPPDFNRVKSNAEILKDTFLFYSRNSAFMMPWLFFAAIGVSIATFLMPLGDFILEEEIPWWNVLLSDTTSALSTPSPPLILINALGMAIVFYVTMRLIVAESRKEQVTHEWKSFVYIFFTAIIFFSGVYLGVLGTLVVIAVSGYIFFATFVMIEKEDFGYGLAEGWHLFWLNNNQGLSLQVIVLLLSMSFLLILSAPLSYIHLSVLKWNFVNDDQISQNIVGVLQHFIPAFLFYLILPIVGASLSYLYFSQSEGDNATALKSAIERMKTQPLKGKRK